MCPLVEAHVVTRRSVLLDHSSHFFPVRISMARLLNLAVRPPTQIRQRQMCMASLPPDNVSAMTLELCSSGRITSESSLFSFDDSGFCGKALHLNFQKNAHFRNFLCVLVRNGQNLQVHGGLRHSGHLSFLALGYQHAEPTRS